MKLRVLLLCVLLALLFISCETKKEKKEKTHGRFSDTHHGKHHGKHNGKHHGRPHGRGRFEEIITDEVFQVAADDDDEEDHRNDWLYEMQDPEGHCNPNPCRNNGVCEEKERGKRKFECDCPKPFKGKKCERGPKPCRRGRCGRGECVVTSTPPYYECKCKYPFKPPNCVLYSVCDLNPCRNGGTCVKDGNDFDCVCPEGFSGRYCRVGPDDCYTGNGESYRGNVSETEDGHECLYWNSHFLLDSGTNPFNTNENEDGLGPHNFCRNPDGSLMPWCFFRKGRRLSWDYCDVRHCDDPTAQTPTVEPTDKPAPTEPAPPPPGPTEPAPPPPPGPTEPAPPPPPGPTEPAPPPPGPTEPVTSSPIPAQSTTHVPASTLAPGTAPTPDTTPEPIAPTNATDAQFKTCGQAEPKKPITRIYAGLKVTPGSIPWQVSIQVKPKNLLVPYRHICGGVLIKSCWVLTAGHCITANRDMQVVLGNQDLLSEGPNEQTIPVEVAIRHENYNEKPYAVYNDIGLLRLEGQNGQCAQESQFVKTACLPTAPLPDGTECTISGWGGTENSTQGSPHLLEAQVLLINQDTCSKPNVYNKVLDMGMLCAGHLQGGVDSCQGDSGGPLTCEENNAHVVYGVVSWGDQCGKKNKPGVYTRITHYLDWIKSKISAPSA